MKKKVVIIIAVIICIIVILRQIGWLDLNLYKSEIGINQSIATSKNIGSSESYSFNLTLKHQESILGIYTYEDGKTPKTSIECRIGDITYSGNYRLPFYKVFKVNYKCDTVTVESVSDVNVHGTVQGEINAKIIGLCSVRKVKEIVFNEITKSVMKDLPSNLQN